MKTRVVITGLGVVSPIGIGVKESWKAAMEGRSGVTAIKSFDPFPLEGHRSRVAGQVQNFDLSQHLDFSLGVRVDRFAQLALVAAKEALADSGLRMDREDAHRVGVIVGGMVMGERELTQLYQQLRPHRVHPNLMPVSPLAPTAAGLVRPAAGIPEKEKLMPADSQIADQIIAALAEYLKRDKKLITLDHRLRDDLGLDSIATIELLFKLEEVFDLQIPEEDLKGLITVGHGVKYVQKRLAPPPSKKSPQPAAKTKRPKKKGCHVTLSTLTPPLSLSDSRGHRGRNRRTPGDPRFGNLQLGGSRTGRPFLLLLRPVPETGLAIPGRGFPRRPPDS
jgi:acyl carrier protein